MVKSALPDRHCLLGQGWTAARMSRFAERPTHGLHCNKARKPDHHDRRQGRYHTRSETDRVGRRHDDHAHRRRRKEHQNESQKDAANPARAKPGQSEAAGAILLAYERRDEIARYDKKHVDADKPPVKNGALAWNKRTEARASARSPSMAGLYCIFTA